MPRAKLSAYKIDHCGLYKSNQTSPSMAQAVDLFSNYFDWANQSGMTVATTKTFTGGMPAYTYNISKSTVGDYLVTLWNESPTINGKAFSVRGNEAVGNATIDSTAIAPGGILGFPTYFYVLPSENIFFTVQVNLPILGINNFGRYLKAFLDRFSKWAVLEESENRLDAIISGYINEDNDEIEHFYARFGASPIRKTSELSRLRSRVDEITKIIKKEEYKVTNVHSVSLARTLLNSFNISRQGIEQDASYKMEINFKPTLGELNNIINRWGSQGYDHWQDVGFKFKGENQTFWLAKMLAKVELDIDIRLIQDNGILKSRELLEILSLNKQTILGSIRES